MQVWNGLGEVPGDLGRCVVTLGNFDGVHRGHRAVLGQLVAEATARGESSVAVTFDPHPVAVLFPDRAPLAITSLDQRLTLMASTGLDAVLVIEFTTQFAHLTPEEFVSQVFVDALHASTVIVGEDTRFGWRNSGNVDTLRELGVSDGFEVVTLADLGEGQRWSSTMARNQLTEGDVEAVAAVLGRPHQVCGIVVHGDHRGRALGFPTANLGEQIEGLVPADGVYAGWLTRSELPKDAGDRTLPAAVSIGTNPTFDGTQRRVEAYVLDRTDLDLYGERVCYELVRRLRPTLRYEGIEPLVRQMSQDVAQCREILRTVVAG
ncbi:bifunctional riboflavin kinase/FAD synthetase [Lapillicoccus sp.]|uniref:bifunctional riboflavin kinase/FAD synthetase n=1 Tax=Lapillicoccus sp. TaxID=1909287 RepID=UPI0032671243